ncbi:hypothetical protein [Campylobacter sp.]|uniref:hypothetical protein n=1 Tax=Campylobacter sp. TaxID=205 RepID=UPI002A4F44DA|nr:hypothetical protein [Campylobacter sp.]MDD7090616.1 hypothetical protein [Campylobacteraceae bacterium]MDY5284489.1 hypothetical protein [Campylobacter sp.]
MNSSLRNSLRNSKTRDSGCKTRLQDFFASHPLVASHPLGERFLVLKPLRKSAVAVAFQKFCDSFSSVAQESEQKLLRKAQGCARL